MDSLVEADLRKRFGLGPAPEMAGPLAPESTMPEAPPEPTEPPPPAPVPEPKPPTDPRAALYARLADLSGLKAAQEADQERSASATLSGLLFRSAGLVRNDQHVQAAAPAQMDDNVRRYLQQKQAEAQAITVPMQAEHTQALIDQAKAHAKYWEQGGRATAGHVKVTPENRDGIVTVLSRLDPKNADHYAAMSDADLEVAFQAKAQVSNAAGAEARVEAADKKAAAAGAGAHGGHGSVGGADADAIADAIVAGRQSPLLDARSAGPVRASLAKRHPEFNLASAQSDWAATQKHISTLNGPQQTRLRQTIAGMPHQLDQIEGLYNEWQRLAPTSGFKLFNRGALALAKQKGGEIGAVAQALETQINDVAAELGAIYQNGNSPTDHALKMAQTNLQADWDGPTFKKLIGLARTNLQIRSNSLRNSMPAGVSEGNRYGPKNEAPAADGTHGKGDPLGIR